MLDRRALVLALPLAACLIPASAALAAEKPAFTLAALQAAKEAGKPVLVEVTAPWCSTCRAQKPILAAIFADPAYKDLVVFDVDFDTQKEALRALKVNQQSTLIVYRKGQEAARSTGETDRGAIQAIVAKAL